MNFIIFFLKWVANNLSIPFWAVGHLHGFEYFSWVGFLVRLEGFQREKLSPHPQVREAFGLTHSNPLPFNPSE